MTLEEWSGPCPLPTRLTIAERVARYHHKFPNFPRLQTNSKGEYDHIYGSFLIGAVYATHQEYYGSYPHLLLDRILTFFPDCTTTIHLFSGTIPAEPPHVLTYDLRPDYNPTICDNIANLKEHPDFFNKPNLLILADPYYENSDFIHEEQTPINKKKVFSDLGDLCPKGTFLVWLDLMGTIWDGSVWNEVGFVGMRVSNNTRYRGLQFLERL